jgi:predicted DNA-binding transcriptional regulator AlpA
MPATDSNVPLAYNIPEAAHKAATSRSSVYLAIASGSLKARKIGRRTVVLHDDLLDWLNNLPRREVA